MLVIVIVGWSKYGYAFEKTKTIVGTSANVSYSMIVSQAIQPIPIVFVKGSRKMSP